MKKQYGPKTLTEFLSESKSIALKRKYGERPAVIVGTNAPLRNQVLSFVAENELVTKDELKSFIIGLKEGSTTPAANMFLKRNAKFFIAESRNGETVYRLSNLGKRLIGYVANTSSQDVSEKELTKYEDDIEVMDNTEIVNGKMGPSSNQFDDFSAKELDFDS
jgi:hypothetical protein